MSSKILRSAMPFIIGLTFAAGCSKSTTTPNVVPTADFGPLTANSTWTYQNTPGASFTLTATNRDTMANGKTYRVLLNSSGGNNYLGKAGSNYYRFGSIAQLKINAAEELYLKDDQPVNATWLANQSFTVPGIPLPLTANLNYSIKEKGISRTVASKAFSNVTHVRLDLSITGFGSIGGGDFYYANGVGLIENEIKINVPGQAAINQTQAITAYSIK